MPKPKLPFLQYETSRHGKRTYYVRFGKGPRVRIAGEYGSKEFMQNYNAALKEQAPAKNPERDPKTLAWLVARYQDSTAWTNFSPATRRQRGNILKQVLAKAGTVDYRDLDSLHISQGMDDRRHTPSQANHFLKIMRHLFTWAVKAAHLQENPCVGVDFAKEKTTGHHVWTREEIAQFRQHWPVGSRERLAMEILHQLGVRRGDAVQLGKQHVRNGLIRFRTEKTGEMVELPMPQELSDVIAASPTGDLTFISTVYGSPRTKAGFGTWFREACEAAGVPGTAHGLRKALATRAAHGGASELELEAMFGWRDRETSSIYTKTANRRRLAKSGMQKALKAESDEGDLDD